MKTGRDVAGCVLFNSDSSYSCHNNFAKAYWDVRPLQFESISISLDSLNFGFYNYAFFNPLFFPHYYHIIDISINLCRIA